MDEDEDAGGGMHTRLPTALGARIDRLRTMTDEGIVSRKAFVADAVREKLERVEAKVMERAGFYSWLHDLEQQGKNPLHPGRTKKRQA